MHRLFLLFICPWLLSFCAVQGQNTCGQYILALRGDTCEQLRVAFHVSRTDFDELNVDVDCNRLRPRQSRVCVASLRQLRQWRADSSRRCPGARIKAVQGDTCSKIGARLDVDEEHFLSHNGDIDCDHLRPGDIICGAPQSPVEETLSLPSESACANGRIVETDDADTCHSISHRYGISRRQLENDNPNLDCRSILERVRLCIRSADSELPTTFAPEDSTPQIDVDGQRPRGTKNMTRCPGKFVSARGNETCAYFRDQHNMESDAEFRAMNPTIDCSRGTIERGRIVCIRRPRVTYVDLKYVKRRGIENMQLTAVRCTQLYRVTRGDTCWTIWSGARLSEKAFLSLNPGLDCSALKVGQEVCIKNGTTFGKPCRLTFTVQPGQTCSSIASLARMTEAQLISLNPNLDCDQLEPKRQLCLSVDDAFNREARDAGHDAEGFLQTASTRLTQRSLIDEETARKIQGLLGSDQGLGADSADLINVLAMEKSIGLIKAVTQSNANFRRLAAEFDQRRSLICLQLTEGQTAYKECVCDEDKPFIHCQAILMKNLQSGQTQIPTRHHKRRHAHKNRARRHRSSFNHRGPSYDQFRVASTAKPMALPLSNTMITIGGAFADFWRYFQKLCPNCVEQGCFALGACFIIPPAPVFQVCVSGGACLPNPAMLITTDMRLTVNQFFSSQINVGVGICITGLHTVLKLVGLAACVASIDLRYYYLRQQMELHPQIALVAVRAYLDALVQIGNSFSTGLYDSDNNVPLADLCLEEAYQCNDFCQLDRGGVVVKYNVEVWFFGWRSVKSGDIKGLPECRPKTLPPPDTLKRMVVFVSGNATASPNRPEHCKLHDLSLREIPTNLGITHVVYSYLSIDPRTFRVTESDGSQSLDVVRMKDSGMQVMVSVGGRAFCENSSTKSVFSSLVSSSANRRAFIESAIEYARRRSLQGIDLAWTNPQQADRSGYASLISEFRTSIDRSGGDLLLSVSAPRSVKNIDMAQIHRHVDFVNLMTYDYHEAKDSYKTDAINVHAPIVDCGCSQEGDVELTVEDYLAEGVPPQKVNLGLATFGRAFKLDENWRHEDRAAEYVRGECSNSPGVLAWYEIKTRIEEIRIDNKTMSAYSPYGKMEWVGFDNQDTLAMKLCFARYKILGGVAVWNANFDDNYELIESIGRVFKTPAEHNCSNVEISRCDPGGDNATRRFAAPEERSGGSARGSQSSKPSASAPTCSSLGPSDSKRCSQAICTTPPSTLNADKSKLTQCANRASGSSCVIECLPGYTISGVTGTVVCVRLFSSFAMWLPPVKCEMTEEGKRACGGDSPVPVLPIYPNTTSRLTPAVPSYLVKFNKGAGIPSWSAYLSKRSDSASLTTRQYRFSRYKCHREDQVRASKYRNMTAYVKSQLTPQIAFDTVHTRLSSNYMINIAAQDKGTRYGPWRVLEARVDALSQSYPAIVATGVCPVTVDQASALGSSPGVPIPSCFWKLVCVKTEISGSTRATVAGFYHENTPSQGPASSSRIDQVKEIRDQNFIKDKLGPNASVLAEIWTSVKQWLWPTVSDSDYPTPQECAGRLTLGHDERRFWQSMVNSDQYGPDWNEFDEEGAAGDASDIDDEEDLIGSEYLAYGIRRQPYERCGRIINGQKRK